jgi:NTE family protein
MSIKTSPPIKNLAIKGGGVLGIAYAGAVKALEENNILQNIEKVAGTSAGALCALLIALGYNAQEFNDIISNTDFKTFEDCKCYLRIPRKYGLYKGQTLLTWIQDKLTRKKLSKEATFADLKNAGCKDLHVFAADLNMKGLKKFSFKHTPNVVVAEAVRASMSIPLFFEAWQFKNQNPNNHIYVDGGVIYNYPITAFDGKKDSVNVDSVNTDAVNTATLGLFLTDFTDKNKIEPNKLELGHILKYIKILFETIQNTQNIDFHNDPEQRKRSVLIDNFGISATDFDITDDDKKKLSQSGYDNTMAYLKHRNLTV